MDELGQKLRQARIDKGYTIDDLQQITKIQKRYLLAIEEGNFDQLPGKFYVNAFIKQYAQTVGLDGQALLNEYQGAPVNNENTSEKAESSNEVSEDDSEKKSGVSRALNEQKTSGLERLRGYLPQIIIIAVVLILIIGIYSIALNHRNGSNQSATASSSTSSVKVTDERKSSSKSAEKSSKKEASKKASESSLSSKSSSSKQSSKSSSKSDELKISKVKGTASASAQTYQIKNYPTSDNTVNVSATSSSTWITITANGSTLWQGSVTASAPQSVQLPNGITSFIVTSGNAAVTELTINDTTVKLPSSASANTVQNYTFQIDQSSNN